MTANLFPAIVGGDSLFRKTLNIVGPALPRLDAIQERLAGAMATGQLTNNGQYVRAFEPELARYLDARHVIAVSNATDGLMILAKALNRQGEVILPSFTYCASAHALVWAGLRPVFADILPDTYTLDPAVVEALITPKTAAIMGVHIYGHPCEVDELEAVAEKHGIPLLFDAAHATGSQYKGRRIGSGGLAEVFSFHATKLFPVGEGGCITTADDDLAEYLSLARKFGDPGNENTQFPGTNAKMQEFNALIGLEMLKVVDQHIANRRGYAAYLIERLGQVPGISFQTVRPYVFTNYQNFAILVNPHEFGLTRDQLFTALAAENIMARKYFYPPLHHHDAYNEHRSVSLPVTEQVSERVLCLPFYSEMTQEMLDGLCTAIERIQRHAPQIRNRSN
jgi:dTDP-4-amino-4,6-dideoxygalactose transaminase